MFLSSRRIPGACSLALALSIAMPAEPVAAQSATQDTSGKKGTMQMPMDMPAMRDSAHNIMIGPAGVSMDRMGSGTTWIPDAVTLPSRTRMIDGWMVMTHGFVFAQYVRQSGERGDEQFGSLNWAMLMATRDF